MSSFIEEIAPVVQRLAPEYGIACPSAVIAQAILESGWGQSELAAKHHNYFGIKCGTAWTGASVNLATKEEYAPGVVTDIRDNFRAYASMEDGVRGYFELLELPRYSNLKGIADPRTYLQTLKDDGYCTSSAYVDACMELVAQNDLTRYDGGASMISNSGKDENGKYSGGQAGDQTGHEWELIPWYDRPWNCVLRYPDPAVGEDIALVSTHAAQNAHVGYDQGQRLTFWDALSKAKDYDPANITEDCEDDCASGVCGCVKATGYRKGIKALQDIPAYLTTWGMRDAFKAAGFQVLTDPKYLTSDAHLLPGDILLNDSAHTAINIGRGAMATAPSTPSAPTTTGGIKVHNFGIVQNGTRGTSVYMLQAALNLRAGSGLVLDGISGANTVAAIEAWQKSHSLAVDGICGINTWTSLLAA